MVINGKVMNLNSVISLEVRKYYMHACSLLPMSVRTMFDLYAQMPSILFNKHFLSLRYS